MLKALVRHTHTSLRHVTLIPVLFVCFVPMGKHMRGNKAFFKTKKRPVLTLAEVNRVVHLYPSVFFVLAPRFLDIFCSTDIIVLTQEGYSPVVLANGQRSTLQGTTCLLLHPLDVFRVLFLNVGYHGSRNFLFPSLSLS